MSKAMDALERLRPDKDCACVVCKELAEDYALLRDYITTTDAERAAFEELEASVCPEDVGFDEYIKVLQKHRDGSAARIKELEEALKPFSDEADRRPFLGVDACRANIAGNIGGSALTNLDLINARAALDGARKVEP